MKYVKACDALPRPLLDEIQKYAQGCLIYIPQREGTRRSWGDKTGARREIAERNAAIRRLFRAGASVCSLAEEFALSPESVKKIVYSRK